MESIKDFISLIASCEDASTLHDAARTLVKTSIFDIEKNTRINGWIQEGKDFKSFKTHLIFML
jgi:hypothetical protein